MATSARSLRPNGSGLSRTFIRNTIVEVNRRRRRLKGVLFGSCKFGDAHNLIELLRARQDARRDDPATGWSGPAATTATIEYTRSSLFDIYFYDLSLPDRLRAARSRACERAVEFLDKTLPNLAENLSLCIVAQAAQRPLSRPDQGRRHLRLRRRRGGDRGTQFKGFGPQALPFFKALKFHQSKAVVRREPRRSTRATCSSRWWRSSTT